jgi:hypothetical protein
MVKAFTPRKKKPVKVLDKRTKTVRINASTLVEVSVSIPDEVAKQRYFDRHQPPPRPTWKQPLKVDEAVREPAEVPLEAIEDIVNEEEAE